MFPNYRSNMPQQFNQSSLPQNFAQLNINFNRVTAQQTLSARGIPESAPHNVFDIGEYVAPALTDSESKWATQDDIQASYQRGSTVLRQQNNSTIDDYYKQFTRPITEYVPIALNGQPTYIYQNLDGTPATNVATITKSATDGGLPSKNLKTKESSKSDKSEEKKDKQKHRKPSSSKNGNSTTAKHSDEDKRTAPQTTTVTTETHKSEHVQEPKIPPQQPAPSIQPIIPPPQQVPPVQRPPQQQQIPPTQRIAPQQRIPLQQHQAPRMQQMVHQQQGHHQQQQQLLHMQHQAPPIQRIPQQVPPMQRMPPPQQQQQQQQQWGQNRQPPIQQQQRPPPQQTTTIPQKIQGGVDQIPMKNDTNPVIFFDIEIDGDHRGRLVMELFRHVLPKTAQNFIALTTHDRDYGYRHSYFHRIIPGFMAQGGDFEKSDGTGGYSIYGEKFDDEGFPFEHDRPGLLSMANIGPNTNGSQFFLTFVPCPHLDKKHVVFGQVIQGFHILKDLELSGTDSGDVSREVKIADCGQLQ